MIDIEKKCKEKGVRLTDQRKVIAQVMSESKLTFGSKDHPDVDDFAKDATLSDDDWIHFIQNNSNAIQKPILIKGKKAIQVETPSDVLQFIDVDSAGLEKHPVGDDPEIAPNTDDEQQV